MIRQGISNLNADNTRLHHPCPPPPPAPLVEKMEGGHRFLSLECVSPSSPAVVRVRIYITFFMSCHLHLPSCKRYGRTPLGCILRDRMVLFFFSHRQMAVMRERVDFVSSRGRGSWVTPNGRGGSSNTANAKTKTWWSFVGLFPSLVLASPHMTLVSGGQAHPSATLAAVAQLTS